MYGGHSTLGTPGYEVQRKWIYYSVVLHTQYLISSIHHSPSTIVHLSYHGWILSQRLPSVFSLRSPAYTRPRVSTWSSPPFLGRVSNLTGRLNRVARQLIYHIVFCTGCNEMIDPTVVLQLFVAYYSVRYYVRSKIPLNPYTVRLFWPKSNGGQLR